MIRYFIDGHDSSRVSYKVDYSTKQVYVKYRGSDDFGLIKNYSSNAFQSWRNTPHGMKMLVFNSYEEFVLEML